MVAATLAVSVGLMLLAGLATVVAGRASAAPAHRAGPGHGPDFGHDPGRIDGGGRDLPPTQVPSGWTTTTDHVVSEGIVRTYLVIRPPTATSGRLPVVIVLPGRHMTAVGIERDSALLPIVGNGIFVYPTGYGLSWNAGGCCGVAHRAGINDVAFLDGMIHDVLASQPDASVHHIYLMGFSNGGRMAYRMACADPGTFAGVAAVEAVPVYTCRHFDPTPMVIVAQRDDPLLTIPTDGHRKTMQGCLQATVGATVQRYRTLDGCRPAPELAAAGDAAVTTFPHCNDGSRLEYVLYAGGAHVWPRGDATTPSSGALIWAFFRHGGLPVLARGGVHGGTRRLA